MRLSQPPGRNHRHDAGFTLIELMVAIVLVGILTTIATPSFTRQIESNRQRSASTQLQQAIRLANAQAIATSRPAILCASSDGTSCDGSWSDGWLLFVDRNRSDTLDVTDRVLLASENSEKRQFRASGGLDRLVFRANGVTTATVMRICSEHEGSTDLDLELSAFGLITITKGVSGGCS